MGKFDWKDFLRPSWAKFLLFFALALSSYILGVVIASFFEGCYLCVVSIIFFLNPFFTLNSFLKNEFLTPFVFLFDFVYYYLLSCILVFIYNARIKKIISPKLSEWHKRFSTGRFSFFVPNKSKLVAFCVLILLEILVLPTVFLTPSPFFEPSVAVLPLLTVILFLNPVLFVWFSITIANPSNVFFMQSIFFLFAILQLAYLYILACFLAWLKEKTKKEITIYFLVIVFLSITFLPMILAVLFPFQYSPTENTLLLDSGKEVFSEEDAVKLLEEAKDHSVSYYKVESNPEGYTIRVLTSWGLRFAYTFPDEECHNGAICFWTCSGDPEGGHACSNVTNWTEYLPEDGTIKKEGSVVYVMKNMTCEECWQDDSCEQEGFNYNCTEGEWIPAEFNQYNSEEFLVTKDGKVYSIYYKPKLL